MKKNKIVKECYIPFFSNPTKRQVAKAIRGNPATFIDENDMLTAKELRKAVKVLEKHYQKAVRESAYFCKKHKILIKSKEKWKNPKCPECEKESK